MPTLSVCIFASEAPAKLAAVVAPLRQVADEILVVVDDQAPDQDLAPLADVADRAITAPFTWPLEATLEWLYGECSGDWILRLDGDEVVSQQLLDVLAGDDWHRDITHCYIPRRWLVDGGASWIKANPWWPDTQLRLIKNEPGLRRSGGGVHETADVEGPSRALAAPMYHLDLIATNLPERRKKALDYHRARPGLRTHGGLSMSVFYMPEAVRPQPVTEAVPPEDRGFIDAAITGDWKSIEAHRAPATSQRLDALDGQSVSIEIVHIDPSGYVGAHLETLISVTNTGTEPIDPSGEFPVRVGAQWQSSDGTPVPLEGRADLSGWLEPGSSQTVLMLLPIPAIAGPYTLSIGVLEEGRQWLDRAPETFFVATEQPRITLAGGYSRHRHLGDDLIVRSLVEEITDEFPQALITALTDAPEELASRFGVSGADGAVAIYLDSTSQGMSPTESVQHTVGLARDHLAGEQINDDRIATLTEQIASSELFLIAAAGSLASSYADTILWPRLIEAEIAHAAGIPIVITSAGLGPFIEDQHTAAAKRLLSLARDIHARDRHVLRMLADLGISGPVSTYSPDSAMGIKPSRAGVLDAFLDRIDVSGATYSIASVRSDDTPETLKRVADAVMTATADHDGAVVLLPHCASEWIDDAPALDALARILDGKIKIVTLTDIPSDEIAADLVRGAESSVGTRFHNAVLSASAGRPAVLVCQSAYDEQRAAGLADLPETAVAVVTPITRLMSRKVRTTMRQNASKPRYPSPHPVIMLLHALGFLRTDTELRTES